MCQARTVEGMQLLSSVWLLLYDRLELRPCFASLNAFAPRVTSLCVANIAAVTEPRTAATATTEFAGFLHCAAFRTYGGGRWRHQCCCYMWALVKTETDKVERFHVWYK